MALHLGTWKPVEGQPSLLPGTAAIDVFLARYSWDYWTYLDQPEWLIQNLSSYIEGEAEAKKVIESRRSHAPSAENTDDLKRLAHTQGFDVPLTPEEIATRNADL